MPDTAAFDSGTYQATRGRLEEYFDRTASETWARLTSDAPVSRIRRTVRAGRDAMRATLLSWLPDDLTGVRILDAGCGTGALAVEAARRGADVVAIDISPSLVSVAAERAPSDLAGSIDFRVGDMLAPDAGTFDHVVAMDSLIHYAPADAVGALERLAAITRGSIVFTHAPRTALLTAMHVAGRFFPRGDRAPAIVPVGNAALAHRIHAAPAMTGWSCGRTHRINSGFYMSQALEVARA